MMNRFIDICKIHSQYALKTKLDEFMSSNGYKTYNENGFLYCVPQKAKDAICFTAHMDTVHKEAVKNVQIEKHSKKKTIISSPQGIGGDDRCGIFMIMELVRSGLRPYVVFCEDEEIGCVGAGKFAKTRYVDEIGKECMFIVELDRRNATDAVYYELDNVEFEQYVTEITGYKTASGSYSDICEIAPAAGIAAVNLSCGYYNEHHIEHYVVWQEMMNTLKQAKALTMAATKDHKQFEYVENQYNRLSYGMYRDFYDDDYMTDMGFTFYFKGKKGEQIEEFVNGMSFAECIGQLMMEYPYLSYENILDCVQDY